MSPALRILTPGLLSTIQDLGRPGYQRLGIPVGGALDALSFRAANALAGNAPGTGAVEAAYLGPTLLVEADDVRLCFAGAQAHIEILDDADATQGQRIETMRSVRLRRGQVVRIGAILGASTLYIAAEGGFAIAPVLGSVSTDLRGQMGGLNGRALASGDVIALRQARASEREECKIELDLGTTGPFRVVLGPQADHFPDYAIARFLAAEYRVAPGSDRMGMRLEGPILTHDKGFNIVSDAIAHGSIQVPGNGQPIVLLADRQTTGGYPKIATVVSADLPALGRLPVGSRIAFAQVTVEQAEAARRVAFAEAATLSDRIVRLRRSAAELAPMLMDCNLISGVVDAAA